MKNVKEVLEYFDNLSKTQIVVSASQIEKVTNRLDEMGILTYFDTVLAHSDYNAGDKTYLAMAYLKEHNISSSEALIIGDSVFDYVMAQKLGCDCVLNTKGHQSRREFAAIDAEIIDDLSELKTLIK